MLVRIYKYIFKDGRIFLMKLDSKFYRVFKFFMPKCHPNKVIIVRNVETCSF